jgi:hypothetical protein
MNETPQQQTELWQRMTMAESHAKEAKTLARETSKRVWVAIGVGVLLLALNVAVIATGAAFLHR